jgi:hypothetical protein
MRSARFLAVAALGVVFLLAGVGPAPAAPGDVPPDVAAAFAGEALRDATVSSESDLTGAVADAVHEVFRFSADFVDGVPTSEPVIASDLWIARLVRDDEVLGAVWVVRPPGAPVQWAGTSEDRVIGTALGQLSPTELLIEDEPNGAYYALDGTTVRPLNSWARLALPRPASISSLQDAVAERYAELREQDVDPDYTSPPGLTISFMAMAVAAVAGGLLLFLGRRRRAQVGSRPHAPAGTG